MRMNIVPFRHTHTVRGMTLIELCIAIALLALITTMSYRGLDGLSRTSDRLIGESERWQSLALFFARFASDVAQPVQRPLRIGTQTETPTAPTAASGTTIKDLRDGAANIEAAALPTIPAWLGQPMPALSEDAVSNDAQLEFTRKSAVGRDEIRLGYRLHAERLELLVWPVLDRVPNSRPEVYTLLEGVSALRFRYLDAAGAWQEIWPVNGDKEPLPRAVEVNLTLRDGTELHRVFALPS